MRGRPGAGTGAPEQTVLALPGRTALAVRRHRPPRSSPPRATAVLVHGLASNARLWDGVAPLLTDAGVDAVAVDLRGHGASADVVAGSVGPEHLGDAGPGSRARAGGHDTTTAAGDVAALVATLGGGGPAGSAAPLARPVVAAGQSWGGNVVLTLAAQHPVAVDGIALLDGGWLRLDRFATFDEAWHALAPPTLDGMRLADVERRLRAAHPTWPETGIAGTLANLREAPGGARNRLDRDHHHSILRSLYDADPRELYPRVRVPALLMPAGPPGTGAGSLVGEAATGLPDARVVPYPDADHDLHAQFPDRVAADLLDLVDDATRRLDSHGRDHR